MTAAQNKFLRIYYARVKECLEAFDAQSTAQSYNKFNIHRSGWRKHFFSSLFCYTLFSLYKIAGRFFILRFDFYLQDSVSS